MDAQIFDLKAERMKREKKEKQTSSTPSGINFLFMQEDDRFWFPTHVNDRQLTANAFHQL
jgi:hypothetical protein